jgi:hypothetical protein
VGAAGTDTLPAVDSSSVPVRRNSVSVATDTQGHRLNPSIRFTRALRAEDPRLSIAARSGTLVCARRSCHSQAHCRDDPSAGGGVSRAGSAAGSAVFAGGGDSEALRRRVAC